MSGTESMAWLAARGWVFGPTGRSSKPASPTSAGSDTIWPLVDAWSLPGLEVYANATCVRTLCTLL